MEEKVSLLKTMEYYVIEYFQPVPDTDISFKGVTR